MEAALKWSLPSNPISYVAPAQVVKVSFSEDKQKVKNAMFFSRCTLKKGICLPFDSFYGWFWWCVLHLVFFCRSCCIIFPTEDQHSS